MSSSSSSTDRRTSQGRRAQIFAADDGYHSCVLIRGPMSRTWNEEKRQAKESTESTVTDGYHCPRKIVGAAGQYRRFLLHKAHS